MSELIEDKIDPMTLGKIHANNKKCLLICLKYVDENTYDEFYPEYSFNYCNFTSFEKLSKILSDFIKKNSGDYEYKIQENNLLDEIIINLGYCDETEKQFIKYCKDSNTLTKKIIIYDKEKKILRIENYLNKLNDSINNCLELT